MKKYKLVDKTPLHSAGMGAIMGGSVVGPTPLHAAAGMVVGAGIGAVAGGIAAMKDRKNQNISPKQFK